MPAHFQAPGWTHAKGSHWGGAAQIECRPPHLRRAAKTQAGVVDFLQGRRVAAVHEFSAAFHRAVAEIVNCLDAAADAVARFQHGDRETRVQKLSFPL